MRMAVLVVLEPPRTLRQARLCIWAMMKVNIIPLERFAERPGHAVRLRRLDRRKARCKADRLGEGDGVVSPVTSVVIREPLDQMRGLLIVKASIDAREHEIADHLAGDAAGGGVAGHHRAIAGVERKGHTNALSVPAGDLEAIRRSAQVRADREDLTIVCTTRRLTGAALQQEAVLRHLAVNAFVVEPGRSTIPSGGAGPARGLTRPSRHIYEASHPICPARRPLPARTIG